MNEETIISFENQNGLRIAPDSDITTGKVVVNGIEITSVEDWEKVTKSLIKLQHNWNELKKWIKEEEQEYRKDSYSGEYGWIIGTMVRVLNKMQELEGVSNE